MCKSIIAADMFAVMTYLIIKALHGVLAVPGILDEK